MLTDTHTLRLDAAVRAVCPIVGLTVGETGVSASVEIEFAPEATAEQQAAAQGVVTAFDWSDAADAAWREARMPERKAMRDAVAAALTTNTAFLAIQNPTNAQLRDQLRAVTQQMTRVLQYLYKQSQT
jgi:hypothetical protein